MDISALADNVRSYYFSRLDSLPQHKGFHWASRLAAWEGSTQAVQALRTYRDYIVPTPLTDHALQKVFAELAARNHVDFPHIPAAERRAPYFSRYPQLFGAVAALFRLRHLQTMYQVDARLAFLQAMDKRQLIALDNELLADQQALQVLSTYAVNFHYLLHHMLLQDAPNPEPFARAGAQVKDDDPVSLQMLAYLYTHCIIGATNFYVQPIPQGHTALYRDMLQQLMPYLESHYDDISLDVKLEFLVCCRICDVDSSLSERIYTECRQSMSPEGTFLIDTQNHFRKDTANQTLAVSEHRNVLFVMSTTPFSPAWPGTV